MPNIEKIEGIGSVYTKKLSRVGIITTRGLLKRGATVKGRKEIEATTGIGHALVLEWVNLADLFRIKGVGEEFSDLLEEAGVDTVVELANRNANNLYKKIIEVNSKKKLVRRILSEGNIEDWIGQAKKLPRVVKY